MYDKSYYLIFLPPLTSTEAEEIETIAWCNKKNIHNESTLIRLILKQQSFSLGETEMEKDCKH